MSKAQKESAEAKTKATKQKAAGQSKSKGKKPGSGIDHLLSDVRTGAKVVEEGNFRLDWTRALDKVKRFQLTDPHRYVLELAQCAIAGGATKIEVRTDSDDVVVSYDAPIHERAHLQQLFDYLFSQDRKFAALKQLALAVNSALALEPRFITVDSADGESGHRLRLTSHTDAAIEPLADEHMLRGTRVHVRDRLTWKILVEFFRTRTAEGKHLAEGCALAPIPVLLDGKDVVRPFAPDALLHRTFASNTKREPITGAVALPARARESAEIQFLMNGVRVVTHERSDSWLDKLGFVGYVDAANLSRNASHSDVHRDKAFNRAVEALIKAARDLLMKWLESRLLGEDRSWRDDAKSLSALERHYVNGAMRVLLRNYRKRLATPIDALLDVPGVVELAVRRSRRSSLRPLWEAYGTEKACYVATRKFDVDLRDLPDGMVPILGPDWVVDELFRGRRKPADGLLTIVESGLKNRRAREAMQRGAELSASEAIIKVAVEHKSHGIVGEFGVRRTSFGQEPAFPELDNRASDEEARDQYRTQVLFLRDGVPLGVRYLRTSVAHGIAVVDCDKFEANDAWDDLQPNGASKSVAALLKRAVARLLVAMHRDFPELPPPRGLSECGYFSEDGHQQRLPGEVSALWPTDSLAQDVRVHVDTVLERHRKPERQKAPWLWTWPLFHTMSGEPVSMAHILGEQPLRDGTVVPLAKWRFAVEQSWGLGIPADKTYLNVSKRQREILSRYIGRDLKAGSQGLETARALMERRRERALLYQRNVTAARARRQQPTLDPRYYVALVPFEMPVPTVSGDGAQELDAGAEREPPVGTLGIPSFGGPPGHVRFLIDDLPLPDIEFMSAIPVHVVIRAPGIEPDDIFEGISSRSRAYQRELMAAIGDHTHKLVAELARQAGAKQSSSRVQGLIWDYLADQKSHTSKRLPRLPAELLDLPLLPTVDRDPLSLRQAYEDACNHKDSLLVTSRSLGRQLQKRPILALSGDKQKVLRRLLNVRIRDYTRALQNEEDVLARLDQPRREPVLGDAAALSMKIDEDGVRGEVGIGRFTQGPNGKTLSQWLDLMHQGIIVEREAWTVDDAPVIGIVESDNMEPNRLWDAMRRNSAYKRVMRLVRAAAEQLFLRACAEIVEKPFMHRDAGSVAECLRGLIARRFQGTPELHLDEASDVDRALAEAPVWISADVGNKRHSLVEIARQWHRTGVVWVASAERGHLLDQRVVIFGNDGIKDHLREIFGDRVRDGGKVVRRDDAAHKRRMNAPALDARIPPAFVMDGAHVEREFDKLGFSVVGQVGLYREYRGAEPGITVVIGLDGLVLCRRTCEHPLRGLAYIDCRGLRPNRDWDGIADSRQALAIDQLVAESLWGAAQTVVNDGGALQANSDADRHRRAMLLDALGNLYLRADQAGKRKGAKSGADGATEGELGRADRADHEALLTKIAAVPMFYTVTGHVMSLDEIRAHVAEHKAIHAISDELDGGPSPEGMVIIRSDEQGLEVLRSILGRACKRYDDSWKGLLEGYRRRREAPRVNPQLGGDIVAKLFVRRDSTTALIGLCRPAQAKGKKGSKGKSAGFGDNSDKTSAVHFHVDHRKVMRKLQAWHPCFEVWVNDDRLTPSADFRDIEQDDEYWRVLATIREHLPEVLARAAETCLMEPSQALRMRLCHYVLDHRQRLRMRAKTDTGGPEARLLAQKIWPCLTSAGREMLGTEDLLAAHDADQLVVVDGDAPGSAIESGLVAVRVAAVERRLLKRTFGKPRDYTETLQVMEAHRQFMKAKPVAAVDLSAIDVGSALLHRRTLDELGWQGELGLSGLDARGIEVRIFHEHRPIAVRNMPAPVRAVCVAQWAQLKPKPDYDGILDDASSSHFDRTIERALWDALGDLASKYDSLEGQEQVRAERVLLTALASYSESEPKRAKAAKGAGGDRLFAMMLERLRTAPLLVDTGGRVWSVGALRSEYGNREIATIEPHTARLGAGLDNQLVLVLDRDDFKTVARLLRVIRYDQRYLEGVETRRRMEQAPTGFKMPRGVMQAAEIDDGVLSGEVALASEIGHGSLALFSGGRQVEIRPVPGYPGLRGYLDGRLATDESFTRVELERDHKRRIAAIYDQRLQAAVTAAVNYRGRRSSATWRALRRYVCIYLEAHLDDLGQALAERREHALLDHRSIPRTVKDALTCPVFVRDDGEPVDALSLLSSAQPIVVRNPSVKKRRGKEPVVLLSGEEPEVALLTALLGAETVFTYENWLASEARAAKKARKRSERQQELAIQHLLTRLKLTLREAVAQRPAAGLRIAQFTTMTAAARGKAPLAERDDGGAAILINCDHRVWKRAAADIKKSPSSAIYLASAVVTGLALQDGVLDSRDALELFTGLAQYSAHTLGEPSH